MSKFWRCHVCNHVVININEPDICPVCSTKNAYCEISENEFNNISSGKIVKENTFSEEDTKRIWEEFAKDNDFKLNLDSSDMVAEGVLANELKTGLKLCPCRVSDEKRENDLKLICPCNFKKEKIWKEKGCCWCGLFVKR